MTIRNLSRSELLGKIEQVKAAVGAFSALVQPNGLIHEVACESLLHAQKHGDVSISQQLYLACGGALDTEGRRDAKATSIVKAEAIKAWFVEMSGNQYTARNGTWGLKDKWKSDNFKLDLAEQTAIQTFAPTEQRVVSFSVSSILKRLEGFRDKIDESFEMNEEGKPYFIGDHDASKAVMNDIMEFARLRVARENPAAMGLLEGYNVIQFPAKPEAEQTETNDRLIRDGVEVEPQQQAAVG